MLGDVHLLGSLLPDPQEQIDVFGIGLVHLSSEVCIHVAAIQLVETGSRQVDVVPGVQKIRPRS
jgi:hypothetical protein